MADLEQRVATLEREVSGLKAGGGASEEHLRHMPELIKLEFRLGHSQLARLSRDVDQLKSGFADLAAKVEALPRCGRDDIGA